MTKRALLLVNRHARKGKDSFAQVIDELEALDFQLLTVINRDAKDFAHLIRQYHDQIDLVIVGGGDGTLNSIVDALLETKLPLGVLPLGTANDLARTLNIPVPIPEACQVLANGQVRYIDLGWVNGKHFFNVASLGLSVKMTERLSKGLKRRWGVLAYGLTALQMVTQTHSFSVEIRLQGEFISTKTVQIAIGNGRYYGGGMAVAADATIDDHQLDLYSLEFQHWWQIFPLLWTLPRGRHTTLPWVRSLQGQEIIIHTRKPHAINTDGELTTQTPATFRVIPQALPVLVPADA
jgi:YegS/Rv2252/BmrU family lipid kinase